MICDFVTFYNNSTTYIELDCIGLDNNNNYYYLNFTRSSAVSVTNINILLYIFYLCDLTQIFGYYH